jgi:hypothetical protein
VKWGVLLAWIGSTVVGGRYVYLRRTGQLLVRDVKSLQSVALGAKYYRYQDILERGLWVRLWKLEQMLADPMAVLERRASSVSGGLFGHVVDRDAVYKAEFTGRVKGVYEYLPHLPKLTPWTGKYSIGSVDWPIYVKASATIRREDWSRLWKKTTSRKGWTHSIPDGWEEIRWELSSSSGNQEWGRVYRYDGPRSGVEIWHCD